MTNIRNNTVDAVLCESGSDTDFIHMGTLGRPHGIKGEICVDWYADSPAPLSATFYLQTGNEPPRRVQGARVRMHQGRPLLLLPQVADRSAAEVLRGVRVLVARDALPPLEEDEAYIHDIIGFSVINDETGQRIGVLETVEFPAGQDVWTIRTQDGREVLFPAVEDFIAAFDMPAREVRILPPPGLLDIYLSPQS